MLKLSVLLLVIGIAVPTNGLNPRKLDEAIPAGPENKCGGCPCNNPCNQSPPPPPPPTPSPPPPAPKPPSNYCPPPPGSSGGGGYKPGPTPPSQYVYVTGPPGNLYPVDGYYSGSPRSFVFGLPLLVCGLLLAVQTLW